MVEYKTDRESFVLLLIAVIVLVVFSFVSAQAAGTRNVKSCQLDSDCVPAQCCHATSAINKLYAPDCSDAACSIECVKNTLDCGQGTVTCNNGICAVKITKK